MATQHLESERRGTGDPRKQPFADSVEQSAVVKTPEAPVEIKTFSKEALDFLKRRGFLRYSLNGQSLKAQELAGRPFWNIYIDAGDEFSTLSSMQSEVAFRSAPSQFFLPKSNNLTLSQQQEMLAEYSYKLQIEFGSGEIEAVMGDAPDYTLLAFLYLDATRGRERLFGQKYGYNHARTKTPTKADGPRVADVGSFFADKGLLVSSWGADDGFIRVYAAPLIKPV